jgi:hypothetical protein
MLRVGIATILLCILFNPLLAQDARGVPQQQLDFLKIIEDARQAYASGQNDMQKGAARPNRARALCNLLRTRRVEGWVGTVTQLTTNNEGKGVISLDVGRGIVVMTANNAFSDIGLNTMLDPNGSLFQIASTLNKGDDVRFSGEFISGDTDCIMEVSLTMSGSIRSPWFIFRFRGLTKR